tara:strand:- start:1063 stop:1737 length:675 start_codon:yes stop_codon:yes gene_type:complete
MIDLPMAVNSMGIFGSEPPPAEKKTYAQIFIDDYIAPDEGKEPHQSIEDYTVTGSYGMKKEARKRYPNLNDYEAAVAFTNDNIKEIKSKIGVEQWESLPQKSKFMVSNLYYNTGSLFNNFKKDLRNGNVMGAAKNSLDVVSSMNKDTGKVGVLNGLINRRARNYNLAASDFDSPKIKNYKIIKKASNKTQIIYNLENDKTIPITVNKPLSELSAGEGVYDVRNY